MKTNSILKYNSNYVEIDWKSKQQIKIERLIDTIDPNRIPHISKTVRVLNKYGICARPAAVIVKAMSKFMSDVSIIKNDIKVSGKSIMGLLTLEASYGCTLLVEISGDDEEEAMKTIIEIFNENFYNVCNEEEWRN